MADLESLVKVELNGREVITPIFVEIIGLTRDHLLANTYQATTPTNLDTPLWLSCSVRHTEM
jgi:hypothetical protein